MSRLALRLLLIASLVMNGIGAPRAMAGSHDHAAMAAQAASDASPSMLCHHEGHHGCGMDHGADAPEPAERSCCDDAGCACGCLLPPVLPRLAVNIAASNWNAAPLAQPATRRVVRHALPPFRPPAI